MNKNPVNAIGKNGKYKKIKITEIGISCAKKMEGKLPLLQQKNINKEN